MAAQDQALRTNAIKVKIHKQDDDAICRMCKKKEETITHIESECSKQSQLKYKRRHDKVAGAVHWSLCNKYSVQCSQQWYQHTAEPVIDKENVKILWHVNIQTDHLIEHGRPDVVVVDKVNYRALL